MKGPGRTTGTLLIHVHNRKRIQFNLSGIYPMLPLGIACLGAHLEAGIVPADADFSADLVLVIGGEEKGLRPLVRQTCDYLVSIPQKGPIGSLNAAVAGAVIMYEMARQRSRQR